jgi:hypothetical protein
VSLATILQLAGGVLEIGGALMMANAHLNVIRLRHLPRLLLSALVRGRMARGSARLDGVFSQDDRLASLQGLSAIALGFVLQLAATIVSWWAGSPPG